MYDIVTYADFIGRTLRSIDVPVIEGDVMKITLMSLNVHPRAFVEAVANAKRTRRRIEDDLNMEN
jgi:hypothetical protein